MATSPNVQSLYIAGLEIRLYKPLDTLTKPPPISLVFLLHGRNGSKEKVDKFAMKLVCKSLQDEETTGALWVVTFDHRNHGTRLVDKLANEAWDSKNENQHNAGHAVDMYSIQLGTAKDISLLIDFLPAYLFPNGEGEIRGWGIVGISLGGHSTWLAMCHDARVRVGIPIIGCPDYVKLMAHRAAQEGIPLAPPYFPEALLNTLHEYDPVYQEYWSTDPQTNPFLGKKVLVLCGEEDDLVPWSASAAFVGKLEVGSRGTKEVRVHAGVGHWCTETMEDEAYEFVREEMLRND